MNGHFVNIFLPEIPFELFRLAPFWNNIKYLITDRMLLKGMEHSLHKVCPGPLKKDFAVLHHQMFLLFSNNYTAINRKITKEVVQEGTSPDPILWLKSGQNLYIFNKTNSTTSQSDLFQCLIALMVMNFFLIPRWNLPQSKSCSLLLVLSQLISWKEHLHLLCNKRSGIGNQ